MIPSKRNHSFRFLAFILLRYIFKFVQVLQQNTRQSSEILPAAMIPDDCPAVEFHLGHRISLFRKFHFPVKRHTVDFTEDSDKTENVHCLPKLLIA